MSKTNSSSDIYPDQTWNLTPLAAGDDDPALSESRQQSRRAVELFATKWRSRPDYLTDPGILLEALREYEALSRDYGTNAREWYYFELRTAQDQNSADLKGKFAAADESATDMQNQLQFFTLQLSRVPKTTQQQFLADDRLASYRHYLERLFAESPYLLSEPEEALLNLLSTPGYGLWVRMTSSFLAQEQRVTPTAEGAEANKTLPELIALSSDRNKPVRDPAAAHINEIMAKHAPAATEEINAILTFKKQTDQRRGFSRPDMPRHLADDIDSTVVDALLGAVSARFDTARRYYQLKAKLLGVKQMAYHERNVEIGQIDREYNYDEAVSLVDKVFGSLDPEFANIFKGFRDHGQIDVYPRLGKAGGAFCAHLLSTQPTYILLNFTNRLQDVQTLAHELGHGINNELIRAAQTELNFGTPISTAEVASTFMEDFVLEELLRGVDDEARLSLLMMKLNDDISSIYRQVAAYQFEQELHQQHRSQGYLPQQVIGQLFQKHMLDYMGEAVEQSQGSQNWWVYWSHFRNFFYVYSYASGLLISKSLQAKVRQDHAFIGQVKQFLSAGLSDSPQRIFDRLGIDLTDSHFWDLGLKEVSDLLDQTEQLARKLGKIK